MSEQISFFVDATILAASHRTKNEAGRRDPPMSSTRKGNLWHFGMKAQALSPTTACSSPCNNSVNTVTSCTLAAHRRRRQKRSGAQRAHHQCA